MHFRKWLNICHLDMYIHGPFDFASVRGCKTRDRVAQSDWDVLHRNSSMFNTPVPCFDVPTYLVHCNCGAHVTFHDNATCTILMAEHSQTSKPRISIVALDKRSHAQQRSYPLNSFWHPLWVLYAFCGISAASFHIALLGDIVIIADAFPHHQRLWCQQCLASLSSIFGPLKGWSPY
jgi:hypothetical protein